MLAYHVYSLKSRYMLFPNAGERCDTPSKGMRPHPCNNFLVFSPLALSASAVQATKGESPFKYISCPLQGFSQHVCILTPGLSIHTIFISHSPWQ